MIDLLFFFRVRLLVAFSFSIRLLVDFALIFEQPVNPIPLNSLIIFLFLVTLGRSLCFSSSKTTFNPFLLTLYLCSITLYFYFFLISPRFSCSEMLICFCSSCIDCYILHFLQGYFKAFFFFGLVRSLLFFPQR